jgi:hypothetical protein
MARSGLSRGFGLPAAAGSMSACHRRSTRSRSRSPNCRIRLRRSKAFAFRSAAWGSANLPIEPYPYDVMAPSKWRISDWKRVRLARYVALFRSVDVYRGDDTIVRSDIRLVALRDSYYAAKYGTLEPTQSDGLRSFRSTAGAGRGRSRSALNRLPRTDDFAAIAAARDAWRQTRDRDGCSLQTGSTRCCARWLDPHVTTMPVAAIARESESPWYASPSTGTFGEHATGAAAAAEPAVRATPRPHSASTDLRVSGRPNDQTGFASLICATIWS